MSKSLSIVSPEGRFRGKCDATDHAAFPRWEEKYSRKRCLAQVGDRLILCMVLTWLKGQVCGKESRKGTSKGNEQNNLTVGAGF